MIPSFERSNALQPRLHDVVPGGAHTFAKGADQYPEGMAPVLVRGQGARVWDVDGNGSSSTAWACGRVTLGHGYEPVLEAVRAVHRPRGLVQPAHRAGAGRGRGLPGASCPARTW